jgi:hypothetical protein
MSRRELLTAWLQYCESHPEQWRTGQVEIPLGPLDMTFDEVEELFDWPSLAEVRTAVEAYLGGLS